MLDQWGHPPDEEIGRVVERERVIRARHVAANAVMAGCTDDLTIGSTDVSSTSFLLFFLPLIPLTVSPDSSGHRVTSRP